MINMLLFIKYASYDVQNTIGYGYSFYTSVANTGGSTVIKGKDGYIIDLFNEKSETTYLRMMEYIEKLNQS